MLTTYVHEKPVVNFRPVLNEDLLRTIRKIPEKVSKDFSRDTKWGLGLVECLLTGQTNKWVNSKCGNIHQARWFNREYRILRVYVSEEDPSEELIRLVNYIVMVYIPVFLDIKHYGLFEFGPLHLLKEVML